MSNRHTIILMQTSQNRATRTFMDYDSISQAMDGICGVYEQKRKEINPTIRNISLMIFQIFTTLLTGSLITTQSRLTYLPYDRQWIKHRTLQHLKKLAGS